MRLDRFYHPGPLDRQDLHLDGPEARHLVSVLRKREGDRVELFDGRGAAVTAEIAADSGGGSQRKPTKPSGKNKTGDSGGPRVRLIAVESPRTTPDFACQTILAVATPKGDRFRWLVEKATELGVAAIQPLMTERSVVEPGTGKMERMEQYVVAACKQCGRDRLLEVHAPQTWAEFLGGSILDQALFLMADQGGRAWSELPAFENPATKLVAIGPEGGWTGAELAEAAARGAVRVAFGPHILRVETAAIAAATLLMSR